MNRFLPIAANVSPGLPAGQTPAIQDARRLHRSGAWRRLIRTHSFQSFDGVARPYGHHL